MKSLLEIQEERLEIALKWERDKGIPNPETQAIIETIIKLKENGKEQSRTTENKTDGFAKRLEGINL